MVHRIISVFALLALIVGINSCYYDNEEELYPNPPVCDTTALTYDANIASIINTKCAIEACHGGTQSPQLDSYQQVSNRLNRINERAVVQGTMPPLSATPLTDCEKLQLEQWIKNNGPEN